VTLSTTGDQRAETLLESHFVVEISYIAMITYLGINIYLLSLLYFFGVSRESR
jgi:hypothetical protein